MTRTGTQRYVTLPPSLADSRKSSNTGKNTPTIETIRKRSPYRTGICKDHSPDTTRSSSVQTQHANARTHVRRHAEAGQHARAAQHCVAAPGDAPDAAAAAAAAAARECARHGARPALPARRAPPRGPQPLRVDDILRTLC